MAIDTSKISWPDQMNIREAALFLGLGEQRIRALVRAGDLHPTKVEGSTANQFAKSELEAFKASDRKAGGTRKEGAAGKAYVIHVTGEKLARVQAALQAEGITLEPRYNYDKMRAYQKGRREKLNAQKRASTPATTTPAAASNVPASVEQKSTRSLLGGSRKS
jgi:hypothetical protein